MPVTGVMRPRARRWLTIVGIAVGLVTGSVLVTGAGASAQVPPIVVPTPGGTPCALFPDVGYVPVYYNFRGPCRNIDTCYETKPYGFTGAGRKACDDRWRASARWWCNTSYVGFFGGFARVTCRTVADAHWALLRALGSPFFSSP